MERAANDVMTRPPHDLRFGIFTIEAMIDLVVYGCWMAVLCLATFSLIVYKWGGGNLGNDCNSQFADACETVFRARGATFTVMTWFSLFLAWEVVHMRNSFFRMDADATGKRSCATQWMRDAWRNKFLLSCVVAGFFSVFPILYIPGVNHVIFLHKG